MFTLYDRIQIEGIMPERALLRLKRVGIPLYDIQKTQNNGKKFSKFCKKNREGFPKKASGGLRYINPALRAQFILC